MEKVSDGSMSPEPFLLDGRIQQYIKRCVVKIDNRVPCM